MGIPLLPCPTKYFFHIDCPGCGLQRSIIALLEGDLAKSLAVYPAAIPVFTLLLFTVLHLKVQFKYGAEIIKWGYIACSAIIMIFYLYKIFTHKTFY
ncbi:MAG: DUF2752 domain-containing protein [Bacteroidales bacterium]|nr:DUF2752 domain-containing protein [Bacteroidales bacterium]